MLDGAQIDELVIESGDEGGDYLTFDKQTFLESVGGDVHYIQQNASAFLGSGPGGNRWGRSPVEYRGNLYVRLSIRPSIRP